MFHARLFTKEERIAITTSNHRLGSAFDMDNRRIVKEMKHNFKTWGVLLNNVWNVKTSWLDRPQVSHRNRQPNTRLGVAFYERNNN